MERAIYHDHSRQNKPFFFSDILRYQAMDDKTNICVPSLDSDQHRQTQISIHSGSQIRVCKRFFSSYFSTKTYVVGTQKNRLNETVLLSIQVLLSTQNI